MSNPDFLCARPAAIIDLCHPLAVLANRMPWAEIESAQHHACEDYVILAAGHAL